MATLLLWSAAVQAQAPRRASAMQRVTGIVQAGWALAPLDSVLAIRVLDARGADLPGVAVRWTLAEAVEGAALRVINATTDSLGVSRAAFTPDRPPTRSAPLPR